MTENSSWDDRLLAEQLKELSILDLSFDLEATGFDMGEIDFRIENLSEKPEAPDPVDQLPSLQEQAVSRTGDLWQLGRHRLFCGNALDRSSFSILMEGKTANLPAILALKAIPRRSALTPQSNERCSTDRQSWRSAGPHLHHSSFANSCDPWSSRSRLARPKSWCGSIEPPSCRA